MGTIEVHGFVACSVAVTGMGTLVRNGAPGGGGERIVGFVVFCLPLASQENKYIEVLEFCFKVHMPSVPSVLLGSTEVPCISRHLNVGTCVCSGVPAFAPANCCL